MFFQSWLSNFSELVVDVGAPGVVCSPSASRLNMFCIHWCSFANHGCDKVYKIYYYRVLKCKAPYLLQLMLSSYQFKDSFLTSANNKIFSPKGLLLTGYFLLFLQLSVKPKDSCVVSSFCNTQTNNHATVKIIWVTFLSHSCLVWTSAGCLDQVYMPKCTELLPCNRLIKYLS